MKRICHIFIHADEHICINILRNNKKFIFCGRSELFTLCYYYYYNVSTIVSSGLLQVPIDPGNIDGIPNWTLYGVDCFRSIAHITLSKPSSILRSRNFSCLFLVLCISALLFPSSPKIPRFSHVSSIVFSTSSCRMICLLSQCHLWRNCWTLTAIKKDLYYIVFQHTLCSEFNRHLWRFSQTNPGLVNTPICRITIE